MVRELEFKSEDLWINPMGGQVDKQCFCPSESTLVETCFSLTQMCAHVKDPISICHKTVGLTAGVGKHENCTQGKEKSWVTPYYGCSLSFEKVS